MALTALSNSSGCRNVLRVLVAADIDPKFGQQLVRESPDLLLAYVGAQHDYTREPAVAFLEAVSGEGFGTDVEAWTGWVNGLPE